MYTATSEVYAKISRVRTIVHAGFFYALLRQQRVQWPLIVSPASSTVPWLTQVDQEDIDSGEIINQAIVEWLGPQGLSESAAMSSRTSLGQSFGIRIGEFPVFA